MQVENILRFGPIVVVGVLLTTGCGPPAIMGDFRSDNSAAKLYAIQYADRDEDWTAIPDIINQLDSSDPLVRMVAIDVLFRMTGETYQYRFEDPFALRQKAVKRWENAWKSGELQRMRSIDTLPAKNASGPLPDA